MVPSDIHFLLCEQHRHEMLAEAERQRLIKQLFPKHKQEGAGLWRLIAERLRRRQVEPRGAWFEGAAALLRVRTLLQEVRGEE